MIDQTRRGELEARLLARRNGKARADVLPHQPPHLPVPLSFSQERMWLYDRLEPNSSVSNLAFSFHLAGPLDTAALAEAVAEVQRRHAVLRTVHRVSTVDGVEGVAVQEPLPEPLPAPPVHDLSAAGDPLAAGRAWAREAAELPFALDTAPPFRWHLARLGADEHLLLLCAHHIAADGWSESVLNRELGALYDAFAAGRPSPLAPLPVQYRDYAAWQRARSTGPAFQSAVDEVAERLAGVPDTLALPFDRKPRADSGFGGGTLAHRLPADLVAAVAAFAKARSASPFMVLLAAFGTLLSRHSGQSDMVIGAPTAGRARTELEGLVGFFVNTLPLRVDLTGDPAFGELVARVRDGALDSYSREDVPFEQVVERLAPQRDPGRQRLVQVMFQLHNTPACPLALSGLTVTPEQVFTNSSALDLTLSLIDRGDELEGLWEYRGALFDVATVRRLQHCYEVLLRAAVTDPDSPVSRLPLLPADERHALLHTRNASEFPREAACVHELFAAQAAATPDAVAVSGDDAELSYRDLDLHANRIAHLLRRHGVGPDVPVGVLLDRSVQLLPALMGILKAGGAYLPIGTEAPAPRVRQLLDSARPPVCLVRPDLADTVRELGSEPIVLTPDLAAAAGEPDTPPDTGVTPEHLVAVFYTSGSTGAPKGVMCRHAGWANRMQWMQRAHGLRPGEAVLLKTPLTFGDSAVELLWPLLAGGRVALLEPGRHRDPRAIIEATLRHGAVHVQFVPGMLGLVLDTMTDDECAQISARVRTLLSSGEAISAELVRRFRDRFGDTVALDNTWGMTEASIDSSLHVCDGTDTAEGVPVPIGFPVDNCQTYVLDEHLEPVPVNVLGDIHVGGAGLARGYLRDPRRTADAFRPNPHRPGERLYATGDRGYVRADGQVVHVGRVDGQVKIRGARIEIGEVEAALHTHPDVDDGAVGVWEPSPGDRRLVAYAVPVAGAVLTPASVLDHLKRQLPSYSVPSTALLLEEFPRNPNGKLDRKQLPLPDESSARRAAYVAPRTPVEELVAGVWCQVLGVERVGAHDDFFALGGHSLLAIRAVVQIGSRVGTELAPNLMFDRTVLAQVADHVEAAVLADVSAMTDDDALAELASQPLLG
ncbi:amino acid adenylation domain-containing protein [Lentzea xinjiangensis]|uniref:Amino acid adenylation domain-containing protein n=1 Tax=Lentzea xinjiangensis TaxID=402600 RepID=A0A1H9WMF3_9PSEU|nr:non-ribosomal peptide synthetase [Lentzea xinjiangensis]SES35078.1 amino acid adenylation domain-containing protein [Lentzea xinjiangensis]